MTDTKTEFKINRPMIAKLNFSAWRRLQHDLRNPPAKNTEALRKLQRLGQEAAES